MAAKPRDPLVATRVAPEMKARFEVLAASRNQTVSAFLNDVIASLVGQNPAVAASEEEEGGASGRISVRLRGGDRELLNEKAASRSMKASGYVAMLVHAHVRSRAPVPLAELNQLKVAVGELSAVGRNLNQLVRVAQSGGVAVDPARLLETLQGQVAEVRQSVAGLVRANLESWETSHA